jgi:hypothetical protein
MVEAGLERPAPVLLLTPAGCSDEENAPTPRRCPDPRSQLVSIEIWKADIQQNRKRTKRLCELECVSAGICSLDVVT